MPLPHRVSASLGNCALGGAYVTSSSNLAYVADERNGTWGNAAKLAVTGPIAQAVRTEVDAVSCRTAGNCAAVGIYSTDGATTEVLAAEERAGNWGPAVPIPSAVPGTTNISILNSTNGKAALSCASPGNCAVGGTADDTAGNSHPVVADERNGTWGAFQPLPGFDAVSLAHLPQIVSISCPSQSPGNCAAAGFYQDASGASHAFVAEEANGTWGSARQVNPASSGAALAISCPATGDCEAGGVYSDVNRNRQAYVAQEANGTWASAIELPGTGDLNQGGLAQVTDISCPAAGSCLAIGSYRLATFIDQPFYAQQRDSAWLPAASLRGISAISTGVATAFSVSCAAAGDCAVTGIYRGGTNFQAFAADESTRTSTALTVSQANVTFGAEQSARLSVAVKPATTGTPAGKVAIRAGPTTLCSITLAAANGGCTLAPGKLHPGTYQLTATYPGSTDYAPATSPAKKLTITK